MPFSVADIGARLLESSEEAPATGSQPLTGDAGERWSLVTVAPGERFEVVAEARRLTLLVLEGIATFAAADRRESLASGHLLEAPAGTLVTVTNEQGEPLRALVGKHPEPTAPTEETP